MKKIYLFVLLAVVVYAVPVFAADWQQDINELRKELRQLHQKLYSNEEQPAENSASENSQMRDKIDEYGSTLRRINERMDELEIQIKQYNDNLDKYNQKMDIRLKVLENRKMGISTVDDTNVNLVSDTAPSSEAVAGKNIVNANNVDDMYAGAMQAYNNALYDEAELGFDDIIKQFPNHKLAGNAQYWLGEVYFKQGNLNKAKAAFKDGYEKYKSGNKAPDSLYRLGVVLANQKDNNRACIVFMSFAEEFPKANADLSKKVKNEAQKLGCK